MSLGTGLDGRSLGDSRIQPLLMPSSRDRALDLPAGPSTSVCRGAAARSGDLIEYCADLPMNIFAIGDIHGRSDLLDDLLAQLPMSDDDLLVFLGDYIDRG